MCVCTNEGVIIFFDIMSIHWLLIISKLNGHSVKSYAIVTTTNTIKVYQ